jgi:hypothetical protein
MRETQASGLAGLSREGILLRAAARGLESLPGFVHDRGEETG